MSEPKINIDLVLATESLPLPVQEELNRRLFSNILDFMQRFGIPGLPEIQIIFEKNETVQFIDIFVNNRLIGYSHDVVDQILSNIYQKPYSHFPDHLSILQHEFNNDEINEELLFEFSESLIVIALSNNSSTLFTPKQYDYFWDTLDFDEFPDIQSCKDDLYKVFQELLDFRISLKSIDKISSKIQEHYASQKHIDVNSLCEEFMESMGPDHLTLKISKEYIKEITKGLSFAEIQEPFEIIRYTLFEDIGITVPEIHFEFIEDSDLPLFQISYGHLSTPPIIGLLPDEFLVNIIYKEEDGSLPEEFQTLNPFTKDFGKIQSQNTIINHSSKTWNALEYIALHYGKFLNTYRHVFITNKFTNYYLESYKKIDPFLVSIFQRRFANTHILMKMLRQLVTDRISIKQSTNILEAMLLRDFVEVAATNKIVFGHEAVCVDEYYHSSKADIENLILVVRDSLKSYIQGRFINSGNIRLYKLNSEIIDLIQKYQKTSEEIPKRKLKKLIQAIKGIPLDFNQHNIIYCPESIRSYFGEIIRNFFPDIILMNYSEVSGAHINRSNHYLLSLSSKNNL